MVTETRAPVKAERHGTCRWLACPAGAGLLALRCGLAVLEITTKTKRGTVQTCYRVQSFHNSKTQRVEGFTLVKLDGCYQDTSEVYHIDASFGPLPLRDWGCDCPDQSYRQSNEKCKHTRSLVAALKKINALDSLLTGRTAPLPAPAVTTRVELEAI